MSGSGQQHMSAAHMTLPLFVLMWTLEDTYITLPYTYKFSMDVIFLWISWLLVCPRKFHLRKLG